MKRSKELKTGDEVNLFRRKGLKMGIEKDCDKRRDKEWCEWRKAKKEKRLTGHRRDLKREANRTNSTRQR